MEARPTFFGPTCWRQHSGPILRSNPTPLADRPQSDIAMIEHPERESADAGRTSPDPGRGADRLVPLLFGTGIVAEVAVVAFMTVIRYRAQRLEPSFFDLSRNGNAIALAAATPILVLLLINLLQRQRWRRWRGVASVAMTCGCLALLVAAPTVTAAVPSVPHFGYLVFIAAQVAELSVLFEWVRRSPPTAGWRRALDVVGRATAIIVFSFLIVVASVLLSPFGGSITDEPIGNFDAGVILGAAVWSGDRPSPVLRERINTGYNLLRNGVVQFLVLTGSNAPNEMAEGDVARRELVKLGVDPTRIVVETHTSSTLEQILYLRDQIKTRQGWGSFIIISDQFHLKRALEICQFNDIDAVGVSSESPLGPQNLVFHHAREGAALVLYWLFGI